MPFRAKTENKAALAANYVADAAKERKTKIAVASSASAVNLVLGIVKVLAGIYTNSLAIVTDGVNNFGDVVSNAGAAIGFGVENKPPTRRFPGGFGRVEYVVTFLMAIIIVAVGGGFAYSAMDRIFYHPVVTFAWTQFGIIAATIAVKVGLAVMFRIAGKKFPSGVLSAQTTDSVLDACITTFALLGLFLSRYIQFPVDAVIGLVISVVMIVSGMKLAVEEFMRLAGGADPKRENGLKNLALSFKGVTDARVRVYDFGTKHAEATVELIWEDGPTQEERASAEDRIAASARRHGILVTFVRSGETGTTIAAVDTADKEGQ